MNGDDAHSWKPGAQKVPFEDWFSKDDQDYHLRCSAQIASRQCPSSRKSKNRLAFCQTPQPPHAEYAQHTWTGSITRYAMSFSVPSVDTWKEPDGEDGNVIPHQGGTITCAVSIHLTKKDFSSIGILILVTWITTVHTAVFQMEEASQTIRIRRTEKGH